MSTDNDDISNLLDELNNFNLPSPNTTKVVQEVTPLKEEELQQYVLDKTKALLETSLAAVQDLTPSVVAGSDSREMDALSKLIGSTAQVLESLQKTSLINKKADRDEKLEKMRLEGKKEIAMITQGPQTITNNNFVVTSREEIMKKLFGNEEKTIENN